MIDFGLVWIIVTFTHGNLEQVKNTPSFTTMEACVRYLAEHDPHDIAGACIPMANSFSFTFTPFPETKK